VGQYLIFSVSSDALLLLFFNLDDASSKDIITKIIDVNHHFGRWNSEFLYCFDVLLFFSTMFLVYFACMICVSIRMYFDYLIFRYDDSMYKSTDQLKSGTA
jgi:hypothetical protein